MEAFKDISDQKPRSQLGLKGGSTVSSVEAKSERKALHGVEERKSRSSHFYKDPFPAQDEEDIQRRGPNIIEPESGMVCTEGQMVAEASEASKLKSMTPPSNNASQIAAFAPSNISKEKDSSSLSSFNKDNPSNQLNQKSIHSQPEYKKRGAVPSRSPPPQPKQVLAFKKQRTNSTIMNNPGLEQRIFDQFQNSSSRMLGRSSTIRDHQTPSSLKTPSIVDPQIKEFMNSVLQVYQKGGLTPPKSFPSIKKQVSSKKQDDIIPSNSQSGIIKTSSFIETEHQKSERKQELLSRRSSVQVNLVSNKKKGVLVPRRPRSSQSLKFNQRRSTMTLIQNDHQQKIRNLFRKKKDSKGEEAFTAFLKLRQSKQMEAGKKNKKTLFRNQSVSIGLEQFGFQYKGFQARDPKKPGKKSLSSDKVIPHFGHSEQTGDKIIDQEDQGIAAQSLGCIESVSKKSELLSNNSQIQREKQEFKLRKSQIRRSQRPSIQSLKQLKQIKNQNSFKVDKKQIAAPAVFNYNKLRDLQAIREDTKLNLKKPTKRKISRKGRSDISSSMKTSSVSDDESKNPCDRSLNISPQSQELSTSQNPVSDSGDKIIVLKKQPPNIQEERNMELKPRRGSLGIIGRKSEGGVARRSMTDKLVLQSIRESGCFGIIEEPIEESEQVVSSIGSSMNVTSSKAHQARLNSQHLRTIASIQTLDKMLREESLQNKRDKEMQRSILRCTIILISSLLILTELCRILLSDSAMPIKCLVNLVTCLSSLLAYLWLEKETGGEKKEQHRMNLNLEILEECRLDSGEGTGGQDSQANAVHQSPEFGSQEKPKSPLKIEEMQDKLVGDGEQSKQSSKGQFSFQLPKQSIQPTKLLSEILQKTTRPSIPFLLSLTASFLITNSSSNLDTTTSFSDELYSLITKEGAQLSLIAIVLLSLSIYSPNKEETLEYSLAIGLRLGLSGSGSLQITVFRSVCSLVLILGFHYLRQESVIMSIQKQGLLQFRHKTMTQLYKQQKKMVKAAQSSSGKCQIACFEQENWIEPKKLSSKQHPRFNRQSSIQLISPNQVKTFSQSSRGEKKSKSSSLQTNLFAIEERPRHNIVKPSDLKKEIHQKSPHYSFEDSNQINQPSVSIQEDEKGEDDTPPSLQMLSSNSASQTPPSNIVNDAPLQRPRKSTLTPEKGSRKIQNQPDNTLPEKSSTLSKSKSQRIHFPIDLDPFTDYTKTKMPEQRFLFGRRFSNIGSSDMVQSVFQFPQKKDSSTIYQNGQSILGHPLAFPIQQRLALQDCLIGNMNQSAMICKIKYIFEHVKQRTEFDLQSSMTKTKLKQVKRVSIASAFPSLGNQPSFLPPSPGQGSQGLRKLKVEPLMTTNEFFQSLPYFDQLVYYLGQSQTKGKKNQTRQLVARNSSFQTLNQSGSQNSSQNLVSPERARTTEFSAFKFNQAENFVMNSPSQVFGQSDIVSQSLLELQIFQPYFISRQTIIQYMGNPDTSPEKLQQPEKQSILDILEKHIISQNKKTKSRLYFKVDLSEDISDTLQHQASQTFADDQSRRDSSNTRLYNIKNQTDMVNLSNVSNYQRSKQEASNPSSYPKENLMAEVEEDKAEEVSKSSESLTNVEETVKSRKVSQSDKGLKLLELQEIEEQKRQSKQSRSVASAKSGRSVRSGPKDIKSESEFYNKSLQSLNDSNMSQVYPGIDQRIYHNSDDKNIKYYEFEIQQIEEIPNFTSEKNLTFLNIKDVTHIISSQQKKSDKIYQEAIENNYSHEQMTPLNCITNSYALVKKTLQLLFQKQQTVFENLSQCQIYLETLQLGLPQQLLVDIQQVAEESQIALRQIQPIDQSARAMYYYNANQIKRMQCRKDKVFRTSPEQKTNIVDTIRKVMYPFEFQIDRQSFNIYVIKKDLYKRSIITDWKLYELILFNIFQNSVKYNKRHGDILIILRCKFRKDSDEVIKKLGGYFTMNDEHVGDYMLETEIIDTGQGISQERQKMLFIPFLELKNKQGIMKVKHDNIGLGLAGSRSITHRLKGDIRLKQSKDGLTVFSFKIPVQITKPQEEIRCTENILVKGQERPLSHEIAEYLKSNSIWPNSDVKFENQVSDNDALYPSTSEFFHHLNDSQPEKHPRRESLRLTQKHIAQKPESRDILPRSVSLMDDSSAFNLLNRPSSIGFRPGQSSAQEEVEEQLNESISDDQFLMEDEINLHQVSKLGNILKQQIRHDNHANLSERGEEYVLEDKIEIADLKRQGSVDVQNNNINFLIDTIQEEESKDNQTKCQSKIDIILSQIDESSSGKKVSVGKTSSMGHFQMKDDKVVNEINGLSDEMEEDKMAQAKDGFIFSQDVGDDFKEMEIEASMKRQSQASIEDPAKSGLAQIEEENQSQASDSQILQMREKYKVKNSAKLLGSRSMHFPSSLARVQFPQNRLVDLSKKDSGKACSQLSGVVGECSCGQQQPVAEHITQRICPSNETPIYVKVRDLLQEKKDLDAQLSIEEQRRVKYNLLVNNHKNQMINQLKKCQQSSLLDDIADEKILDTKKDVSINISTDPVWNILLNKKNWKLSCLTKSMKQPNRNDSSSESLMESQNESEDDLLLLHPENYPNLPPPIKEEKVESSQLSLPRAQSFLNNHRKSVSNNDLQLSQLKMKKINQRVDSQQFENAMKQSFENQILNMMHQKNNSRRDLMSVMSMGHISLKDISQAQPPQNMLNSHSFFENNNWEQFNLADQEEKSCDCKRKILVVDDHGFNVYAIRELLQQNFGIKPDEAENGQLALDMVTKELSKPCQCKFRAYQLIFMDIQMPVMDGFEATKRILETMGIAPKKKEDQPRKNKVEQDRQKHEELKEESDKTDEGEQDELCHIVAVTAYTSSEVAKKCKDVGMKVLVEKPINAKKLKRVVFRHFFRMSREQVKEMVPDEEDK